MNVQESHREMKSDSALKKMKMGANGRRDVEAQMESVLFYLC